MARLRRQIVYTKIGNGNSVESAGMSTILVGDAGLAAARSTAATSAAASAVPVTTGTVDCDSN